MPHYLQQLNLGVCCALSQTEVHQCVPEHKQENFNNNSFCNIQTQTNIMYKLTWLLTFCCFYCRGNCLVWYLCEWYQTGGCVSGPSAGDRCTAGPLQSSMNQWCPDRFQNATEMGIILQLSLKHGFKMLQRKWCEHVCTTIAWCSM